MNDSKREVKVGGECLFEGKIITLYKDVVLCPNGNRATREIVRHKGACCIIAETNDGKIIMEKQFRYPYDTELIEVPAGKMDPGEVPEQCAVRELEEETGYRAHHVAYLGKIFPTVAYSDEVIHIFYAWDLEKTHQHLDENETLDYYYDTMDHLLEQVRNGEIVDSKTICAILKMELFKKNQAE